MKHEIRQLDLDQLQQVSAEPEWAERPLEESEIPSEDWTERPLENSSLSGA